MKWRVLACDYDGTLAEEGIVKENTVAALDRFRDAGGRLLMVTGRELGDLERVCQALDRCEPHQITAAKVIRELNLQLQIIYNKGAVMILPKGVDKTTGLRAAMNEMRISSKEVLAVGDAENDRVFLGMCGMGVAVSNATPELKQQATLVTKGARGDGVIELIDRILTSNLFN
jgi:hydroxymethylpyrimidine pyrophosphatase-like HAD family hydrolase